MDNAMVKRGIGAVVLAIIAALLLGYLLKDKSRERQEVVEMKLPGAPEITIPSLSDATDAVTESAATLVNEATDTVSNAGSTVVASATGALDSLSDGASKTMEAVTDGATTAVGTVTNTVASNTSSNNPGFSFRPPQKNEEQEINTTSTVTPAKENTTTETAVANDTVVASTTATPAKKEAEKTFKPTIEKEPKKVVKKVAKKSEPKAKPKPKPVKTSSSGGKYTIQLLATSSQSRANKLAKTMNSEGYVSFITQTTSNNKILYRVRVGGHKDRNAALTAQQSMKRRYQKNFFVQNSLVVSQ